MGITGRTPSSDPAAGPASADTEVAGGAGSTLTERGHLESPRREETAAIGASPASREAFQQTGPVGQQQGEMNAGKTIPSGQIDATLTRGDSIGRYIVINTLGSGGMGVVYTAYDPELDRKVAIKLLRSEISGLKAEQGRSRMLREAQALARLSHPNVIPVFDVGALGNQVFIAMEYIDGHNLKNWLEEKPRNWRHVLNVFTEAGRGLAAAHNAGLVHRDFKPSNVLVGNDGRVRVVDFGLARVAEESSGEASAAVDSLADTKLSPRTGALAASLTGTGVLMGTPSYMSPEQLLRLPIDARTDQFSFCTAFYEGLYGQRPFAGDSVEALIAEVTGGRISAAPKSSAVPGRVRRVLLRGLRTRPEERYPSMDALLAELARGSRIARPRSLVFAAIVLLLGLGAVGYRRLLNQQSQICKGADQKLAGVWDVERRRAVSGAFMSTGKAYAPEATAAVARVLDAYAAAWVAMQTEACEATWIRGEQSDELLDLRMDCLGRRLEELKALVNLFERADAKLVQNSVQAAEGLSSIEECANATALRAPIRPPADPATRSKVEELRQSIARAQALETAGNYREGLKLATAVLADANALNFHPVKAEALHLLASFQGRTGEAAKAEQSAKEAILEAEYGRHDQIASKAWTLLIWMALAQGHYEQGQEYAKHAFATIDRAGGSQAETATALMRLGNVFFKQGKYEEALSHHQRVLAIHERLFGPDHPRVAMALNNIGAVFATRGMSDQALTHFERGLTISEKTLGPNHPEVATSLNNIGFVFKSQGKYEEALSHFERALAIKKQAFGSDHPSVATTLFNIGNVLRQRGELDTALSSLQQSLAIYQKSVGPKHVDVGSCLNSIANLYTAMERYGDALAQMNRALGILQEAHGNKHPDVALALSNMGNILAGLKRYQQARSYQQRALESLEAALGTDHPNLAYPLTGIGEAYLGLGKASTALPPLERALSIRERRQSEPVELAATRFALARALALSKNDPKRAHDLALRAREAFDTSKGSGKKLAKIDAWLARN